MKSSISIIISLSLFFTILGCQHEDILPEPVKDVSGIYVGNYLFQDYYPDGSGSTIEHDAYAKINNLTQDSIYISVYRDENLTSSIHIFKLNLIGNLSDSCIDYSQMYVDDSSFPIFHEMSVSNCDSVNVNSTEYIGHGRTERSFKGHKVQ